MYVKIEPSGCCERKGMVQVRLCMYLELDDYGYEKHYVQVPVFPPEGYPGKVDVTGAALDIKDYEKWVKGLPLVWQNNPFHNHFIYVEPDTMDDEIMDIGEAFLHEAGIKWDTDSKLDLENPSKDTFVPTLERISECILRAKELKLITSVRTI